MTPTEMAQIHAAAFVHERGWRADEFADLLAQPYITAFTATGGFSLIRTLAGESEMLTLAVAPQQQRRGIAQGLLLDWITAIQADAETAFLEVAADNHAAISLYTKHGFVQSGLRKAYYMRKGAPAADAVVMNRPITQG